MAVYVDGGEGSPPSSLTWRIPLVGSRYSTSQVACNRRSKLCCRPILGCGRELAFPGGERVPVRNIFEHSMRVFLFFGRLLIGISISVPPHRLF